MSTLACASGLYCLEQGRYKAAALKFAEVLRRRCRPELPPPLACLPARLPLSRH